jgi:hypothetical protein
MKLKLLYSNFTSIYFLHIPIPELYTMYNVNPVYGHIGEFIGCPLINSGFFAIL